MATPFDDLITPVTRQEVEAKIYEILGLVGVSTTSWKSGGVVRTVIVAFSAVIAAFSSLQALIARSGFLELANDRWLTAVAHHVYNVDRELATFAAGQVTLINTGGGIYTYDPSDLTFVNARTGKTYRNQAAVVLGALSTLTVAIAATESGSNSTAAPGEISLLQNALPGVLCSNAASVVGADDELDPALRVRCAEKLGALSPLGPWDAYSYVARNARRLDGSAIGIKSVRTVPDGFGNLTVYVASSSGTVAGDQNNPATDLGAINDAVQKLAAPLAVSAYTVSATPVIVSPMISVWLYNTSGLTPAQIQAAITAKLVAFFAAQPLGGNIVTGQLGKLYLDAMRTAIGSALPQIFHVAISTPATDVDIGLSQIAVLGAITFAGLTQVPPSEGSL
ncbi:MAG: baseplate J/gp47 family protein [Actinobacteria bacterium]|nr:baseplate J/gp47 family protein [Actinomycetota bacterium]